MSVMFDGRLFITAIQLLYSPLSTLTFSDTSRDSETPVSGEHEPQSCCSGLSWNISVLYGWITPQYV